MRQYRLKKLDALPNYDLRDYYSHSFSYRAKTTVPGLRHLLKTI